MRRLVGLVILLALCMPVGGMAQTDTTSEFGDPPTASLISISAPNEAGVVTITGASGAVFPAAQVSIKNLYTEEITHVTAGITGGFEAQLFGPGNTPFAISPVRQLPAELRNQPGALPGGPGTIIVGPFPESRLTQTTPTTQLVVDGDRSDWENYPQGSVGRNSFALRNLESFYFGTIDIAPDDFDAIRLTILLAETTYSITLNPRSSETALWARVDPTPNNLGTLAVATSLSDEFLEMRVPFGPFLSIAGSEPGVLTLGRLAYLNADGDEVYGVDLAGVLVPEVGENNGVYYVESQLGENPTRFSVSGPVADGSAVWHARGRIDAVDFAAGDNLLMELDVTLTAPLLPESLAGLAVEGRIYLQPVIGPDGQQGPGSIHTNNGWSRFLTPSGLAISGLTADIPVGAVRVSAAQIIRRDDNLLFGMSFDLPLPDDLPAGGYVPVFEGVAGIDDGEVFPWASNTLLGEGDGISRVPLTRLPIVLNVGEPTEQRRLVWTLFQDHPSDGSRGVLAQEDRDHVALANRVRYDSPTYILPPSVDGEPVTYPLEPYLLNVLPNVQDSTAAPLLPFLYPTGRLEATVTRPDGEVDSLGAAPILQNRFSSTAVQEFTRFGAQGPIDVYRLTTLNPTLTAYTFDTYGEHIIELTGFIEDVWGNRYEGGGSYPVLIAETLDISPGVLPGTPFEVGDAPYGGLRIAPGVAADVTVEVTLFPLDGGDPVGYSLEGRTNRFGYYSPEDEAFIFEEPGEYIIDYEVRFTDANGRLWAGSLRGAGVVGTPQGVIAHGERGLSDYTPDLRPAWFNAEQYTVGVNDAGQAQNPPYQSGDVVWLPDGDTNTLVPVLRLQDTEGDYADWFIENWPGYTASSGLDAARLVAEDELPLITLQQDDTQTRFDAEDVINDAYAYLSYVRPGVTVRQMVLGSEHEAYPVALSPDDPSNEQIGAGVDGVFPPDYLFLFGGAVLRNPQAGVMQTAIYGAAAVMIDPREDPRGPRTYPPYRGAAGAGDGGPLFEFIDEDVAMFFHPTSVQPGEVLAVGNTLSIAGQVAPTLANDVQVTITSPSGQTQQFEGRANAIGYFYDPANDFTVTEPGVWQVGVTISHTGTTSAGETEPPPPTGGLLGGTTFEVYVLPLAAPRLEWTQDDRRDFMIPAGFPYNFALLGPEGWTDLQGYITLATPAFPLVDEELPVQGRSLNYQYSPTQLAARFPFYEADDARLIGPSASDPVRITFVITGLDENGVFSARARQFTLRYDRLISLE